MLVVLLVCSAQRQKIGTLGVGQKFNPLVDKNIVHEKVSHSVQHNAQSDVKQIIEVFKRTKVHQSDRWYGKYDKEVVVLFKNALIAVVVMVPVQKPKETVHNIFVDNPGCPFHQCKREQND